MSAVTVRQTPLTCPGHTRPVVYLHYSAVSSTGYYLISACKDGKPMLRQGDTGDWIGTFDGHKGAVWGASLNSDASLAATGAADFSAKLWSAQTGEELCTFVHKHIVKVVDFSEGGDNLLTGCNDKCLRVYDIRSKSTEAEVTIEAHDSAVKCAIWSKNPNYVVSCAEDSELRLWDIRNRSCAQSYVLDTTATSTELSRDRNYITVAHGKMVTILNCDGFTKVKSFTMPTKAYSASLHPNKSCFVVGGEDFKIYKFDYDDGKELESYKGHFGPVHCVRYSPDGEIYCSGSEDGTIRLWLNTVGKTYGLWKSSE